MREENVLEHIERSYDIQAPSDNQGKAVWPLLRQYVYFQVIRKTIGYNNKLRTRNKWQLLKNFFYGYAHWMRLRRFDYVFFSNADKRRFQNGSMRDVFFESWADKLGQDRSLFVEWAIRSHHPKSRTASSYVVDDLPLKLLVSLVRVFTPMSLNQRTELDRLKADYGLEGVEKELRTKQAEIRMYRALLRLIEPKGIFVLSSFTKVSLVIAARELGIAVYEAQHGYIGDYHPFYFAEKQFPESYPDHLLSFGEYERQMASKELIFRPDQIIPVGSSQLEEVKRSAADSHLVEIAADYSKVFCLTLQAIQEEEFMNWVLDAARTQPDWLFIIRPKDKERDYRSYTQQHNIIEVPDHTIYDVMKIADYNITIFSTTAIEGQFLGAVPVLYNLSNLSRQYFDQEKIEAIFIEPGEPLGPEALQVPSLGQPPFFVEGYADNVNHTESCF